MIPKHQEKSDDEVENTFQRLYNRYVKEVETEPKSEQKFISYSEAEVTSGEEDMDISFSETLDLKKEQSVTPKGPSPSLVTPTASPLTKKKNIEIPKEEEKPVQTVEEFRQKHSYVGMKPGEIF